MKYKKRLGIALGGGGSRALSHLGVLTTLAEENIPVSCIAGSSLGALLAGMYAFEPDAEAVSRKAAHFFSTSPIFGQDRKPPKDNGGLSGGNGLGGRIKKYFRTATVFNILAARSSLRRRNPTAVAVKALLPDKDISEAVIPLACNALNLTAGKLMNFTAGNIRRAVLAGTAVAIVFPPVKWNGGYYTDAAPVSSVPVNAARELGADVVLAVDIRSPMVEAKSFHTGFEVVSRLESISSNILNNTEINSAEIVIKPEVQDIFWGDFSDIDRVIALGREATKNVIEDIRKALL
ncbi:MAG: patatin-like phospholipase family protein [Planctomycetes bacterium]|nr:patatin-like phospholipase family protein [Planctomycetota bacterium]